MKIPKYNVPVRVSLTTGDQHFGVLFLRPDQRVMDVLSDERDFLPFQTVDGTSLLGKAHLVRVEVLKEADVKDNMDLFPDLDLSHLKMYRG